MCSCIGLLEVSFAGDSGVCCASSFPPGACTTDRFELAPSAPVTDALELASRLAGVTFAHRSALGCRSSIYLAAWSYRGVRPSPGV